MSLTDTTDGQSFGFRVVAEADARPVRYGTNPLTRDRPRGDAPVNDLRLVDPREARALLADEPGGWAFEPGSGGYVERTSNHSDVAEVVHDEEGPLVAAAPDLAHTVVAMAVQHTAVLAIHRPSKEGHQWTQHRRGDSPFCVGCWEAGGYDGAPVFPCPTARALGVTE